MEAEALIHIGHVVTGGSEADAEANGHLLLRKAEGDECEDLELAIGQGQSAGLVHYLTYVGHKDLDHLGPSLRRGRQHTRSSGSTSPSLGRSSLSPTPAITSPAFWRRCL